MDTSKFDVHKIVMGGLSNNSYLIVCAATNQSIIIDAPAEPDKLLSLAKNTNVTTILITHTHTDHTAGLSRIQSATGAQVAVHQNEASNLSITPDILIPEQQIFSAGQLSIVALNTPGHTSGSTSYLIGKYLFSGDTLFPGGPGATRTPENLRREISSITTKLLPLPTDTIVCPGHGENTTIENSRREYDVFKSNPHPHDLCGNVEWLHC